MSTVESGGVPRTIIVNPATLGNTLSFEIPGGIALTVESVFANIDATAAGDTTALLTITDKSGAVIAKKRQTEVVTGGTNPGSATWALRLADEGTGGGGVTVQTEWLNDPVGVSVGAGGVGNLPWKFVAGDALLDLTVPAAPLILQDGLYTVSAVVTTMFGASTAGASCEAALAIFTGNNPQGTQSASPWPAAGLSSPSFSLAQTVPVTAGTAMILQVANGDGANAHTFFLGAVVVRIA